MITPLHKWKFLSIIFFTILLVIAFRENYHQRIKSVLVRSGTSLPTENRTFYSNVFYGEQTDYQSLFKSQRNIVMLGNSMTFRMHWDELLNRTDVANRGIGSDVIKGFYYRLDKVVELRPRICFIEGGANDIEFGINSDSSLFYLKRIVDRLKNSNIIPVVTHVIYVTKDYRGSEQFNARARELNEKIDSYFYLNGVEIMDLNLILAPNGFLESDFAQADGIHLKAMAYAHWKRLVSEMLLKYHI